MTGAPQGPKVRRGLQARPRSPGVMTVVARLRMRNEGFGQPSVARCRDAFGDAIMARRLPPESTAAEGLPRKVGVSETTMSPRSSTAARIVVRALGWPPDLRLRAFRPSAITL